MYDPRGVAFLSTLSQEIHSLYAFVKKISAVQDKAYRNAATRYSNMSTWGSLTNPYFVVNTNPLRTPTPEDQGWELLTHGGLFPD